MKESDFFGENVFSIKTMRNYLSKGGYKSLLATMQAGNSLEEGIADEVADAMKSWAIEHGATHYTHWFQPLTGMTAEKHDSFVVPDGEGGMIMAFSAKELTRGEPDASSFPSGGLRVTFEARGYTAWDPTSPAFLKESENGTTLCIPTVFYGYHGEALDKKIPLLRSIDALSRQVCRMAELFGVESNGKRATVTLGVEQEYFLVDRDYYEARLDLLQTERTLFGCSPAKHQQMDDHYFGAIKRRVLNFMADVDKELWRLGVPVCTRHNEVCPAQFELAVMFEDLNLAVDHNMISMEVLRDVAEQHGLVCLLHEKPFDRVNGSGKHNNWSVDGPDDKNWLKPGKNPHENAKFLTMICALIQGVDRHADLLRASVASAGNDCRLGGHEAPPAIISVYLGDQLQDVVEQIEGGGANNSKDAGDLEIGVTTMPPLPRDATDRNRTSPFAYTGNKFEFRAVGSNQNCADANVVLNTIVAESLEEICNKLDSKLEDGTEFNLALQGILREIVKEHKRVLFNGDNYTKEWLEEAEKRGLPNLRNTSESLKCLNSDKAVELFEKQAVFSRVELDSRYEAYKESYEKTLVIEGRCALNMVQTTILPAVFNYQRNLADTLDSMGRLEVDSPRTKNLLIRICSASEKALASTEALEVALREGDSERILEAMGSLRGFIDELESLVPAGDWPLPTYTDMMFRI